MLQFPKHLICHSDSFFIGQKIPHLSQSDYLKLGYKYFLLPSHLFQSVLSFVTLTTIASSTIPSKNADFVKNISSCRLFDVHKTPSGTLQISVSDEFIARLVEGGKMRGDDDDDDEEHGEEDSTETVKTGKGRVCTTPELEKDYTRLVGLRRSREWKPKLETIREKEKKKLAKRFSSFGIKMRKKSTSHAPKGNQKRKKAEKLTPPSPHPLKFPKLRIPKKSRQKKQQQQQQQQQLNPPPPPPPPPRLKFPKLRIPKKSQQKKQQQQPQQLTHPPPPPPPPPLKFLKLRIPKKSQQKKQEQQPQQLSHPPLPPPPPPPLKFPKLRIPKKSQQKKQQQQQQMSRESEGKEKKGL